MLAVRPEEFSGGGIERDDRTPCAGSRVDHAVDHQRRAFELELGAIAEAIGLETPRDFELAEVGGVDLIERFVAVAAQIAAIGNLSRWAFLLTFAGVGLRTNLRELGKQSIRPFAVGAIGEIAIAALTLGLIFEATHVLGL